MEHIHDWVCMLERRNFWVPILPETHQQDGYIIYVTLIPHNNQSQLQSFIVVKSKEEIVKKKIKHTNNFMNSE